LRVWPPSFCAEARFASHLGRFLVDLRGLALRDLAQLFLEKDLVEHLVDRAARREGDRS
jgi:hypothetical protein